MSGQVLALLAALLYAFSGIITRRAVTKVSNLTVGTLLSIAVSVPYFFIILLTMGQITDISGFSWINYVFLSAAGIVHFMIGRSLYYYCIQLVGTNLAGILSRVGPLVPFILGVTILSEPLSWQLTIGVLLIIIGVIAAGLAPQLSNSTQKIQSGIMLKAILFGLGSGITWGISSVLIKVGLQGSGSPIAGTFISFSAATIGLGISLLKHERRKDLLNMEPRTVLLFCIPGFLGANAQLMRFVALNTTPVSVIAPLFSTTPIFIVFFSFLLNRRLELFSKNVIIGAIAVVAGTILLI